MRLQKPFASSLFLLAFYVFRKTSGALWAIIKLGCGGGYITCAHLFFLVSYLPYQSIKLSVVEIVLYLRCWFSIKKLYYRKYVKRAGWPALSDWSQVFFNYLLNQSCGSGPFSAGSGSSKSEF